MRASARGSEADAVTESSDCVTPFGTIGRHHDGSKHRRSAGPSETVAATETRSMNMMKDIEAAERREKNDSPSLYIGEDHDAAVDNRRRAGRPC